MLVDVYLLKFLRCQCTLNYGFALYLFTFFLCLKQGSLWFGLGLVLVFVLVCGTGITSANYRTTFVRRKKHS